MAVRRTLEYSSRREKKKNEENTEWRRSDDYKICWQEERKNGRKFERVFTVAPFDAVVQYELLIAALHIPASCHNFYYPNMAESLLTECRAALLWVNEIYEGGIEQSAKCDRHNRI